MGPDNAGVKLKEGLTSLQLKMGLTDDQNSSDVRCTSHSHLLNPNEEVGLG